MDRYKKLFGVLGIAGAFLLLTAVVLAAIFNKGGLLPLNSFMNELGLYSGSYFTASFTLLFNLSLALFGLLFGAMFVYNGICEATLKPTVLGFFGALTGILATAQAVFTINLTEYHYIVSGAFYCSFFILTMLYAVFSFMQRGRKQYVSIFTAVLSGLCGGAFGGFILTNGMADYLIQAASMSSRSGIMPFALIGWAAMLFMLAFTVQYGVYMIKGPKSLAERLNKIDREIEL